MEIIIHGVNVVGVKVDRETRCAHYHGENDVIAIRFKCCDQWFPCYQCHAELTDHPVTIWPGSEFDRPAILCGRCGHQLTTREYLKCESNCPRCIQPFNAGCVRHHRCYFEV